MSVVLPTDENYFLNSNMSEITDGNYKILGKVVKLCKEIGEISLLRNTVFSKLQLDKKKEFPVLLNMEVPIFYAYFLDSVVAEKFEAIVQLGYGNSRYKDFYNIYILAATYDFDGNILRQAVVEIFDYRNTGYNDIVAFEPDFAEDVIRQSRWRAFIKSI